MLFAVICYLIPLVQQISPFGQLVRQYLSGFVPPPTPSAELPPAHAMPSVLIHPSIRAVDNVIGKYQSIIRKY